MKARKQKKPSFGVGWVTTDEDERNLRRYRAEMEPMTVRFVGDKSIAPFGDYDVISVEGREKRSGAESVDDVPDEVSSLTNGDYSHIQREGMLSKEVIATLDYALNKGFIPNAEHRMRILMEECANLANEFGLSGMK